MPAPTASADSTAIAIVGLGGLYPGATGIEQLVGCRVVRDGDLRINTKTKLLKRQMYGRAGLALLRHRILLG